MDNAKLYDEATKVTAEDGEVILDGPDGVDVRVTPEAAEQTALNLRGRRSESAGSETLQSDAAPFFVMILPSRSKVASD